MKKLWMMLALMLLTVALLVACAKTPETPDDTATPDVTDTDAPPAGDSTDPVNPGDEEDPPLVISGNSHAKDDREENKHEPDARLTFQKTGGATDVMQADFATPDTP